MSETIYIGDGAIRIGKEKHPAIKSPVNRISHGGIDYEFQRGDKFSVSKVWVNRMPYPITYRQDMAIDGVSVQMERKNIGYELVIASNFPVPTKWKRKLKMLVRAIHAHFVELGSVRDCEDADIAYVTDFIFRGETKPDESSIVEVSRPNNEPKTANEWLPGDMRLTAQDMREFAKVFPFRLHR